MRNEVTKQFSRPRRGGQHAALIIAVLVALAGLLTAPTSARAQADDDKESAIEEGLYSCGKARGKVSVSFKPDVELKDLITWAMGFTCKNFVYGSGIGGRSAKVTIIAPKKMSARQAWQVFLVSLQTMGLTVVPQGNVLRIVESAQAKGEPLPLYRKGTPGATSQLVRMVLRPAHLPVEDVASALGLLKSKEGMITSVPKAGLLVVTDYGSIINKMSSLMREMDQPVAGETLYIVKVKNADATEIAAKVQEILGTQAAGNKSSPSPSRSSSRKKPRKGKDRLTKVTASEAEVNSAVPSKIVADERTNNIILMASEPAYLRTRALIKRLDQAIEIEGAGRIHVYLLENADAEEMSTTLTAVISGIQQSSGGRSAGRNNRPRSRSDRGRASSGGSAGAPAFEGQVRVTHDKPTNSLVVIASVKDFLALRDVIQKLDTPRMQVFIEAMILEVKTDNSRDLGTSFHAGTALDDGAIALGGLQHTGLQSIIPATLASQQGLVGGILGPLLDEAQELLGTSIPSFGLLFQALATSNNVNVLSSPHILTTNNEEAELSVGENIPYQSSFSNFGLGGGGGTTGGAGGFGFPVQSVQRQDVALTLKITPHINASDMVRLEIDQEISDIASPDFAGLGPSWAKRTIKTTVVVRDQQSIVIGGLMSDRTTYTESKIPLLGDVPLLGYLFKYTQKTKAKTNLLVLLTPYVIKDQMDIEQILQRKVRERNEFIRTFANFANIGYHGQIDYRRKRGIIEEINRSVKAIERDARLLREADMKRDELPDGPIEYFEDTGDDGADEADEADDPAESTPDAGQKAGAKAPEKKAENQTDESRSGEQGKKVAANDAGDGKAAEPTEKTSEKKAKKAGKRRAAAKKSR